MSITFLPISHENCTFMLSESEPNIYILRHRERIKSPDVSQISPLSIFAKLNCVCCAADSLNQTQALFL